MVKKEFSCDQCGHLIVAISPDDSHHEFFLERCCEKSLERKIECDNCDFMNTRYWCIHHTVIASTSYDTESDTSYSFQNTSSTNKELESFYFFQSINQFLQLIFCQIVHWFYICFNHIPISNILVQKNYINRNLTRRRSYRQVNRTLIYVILFYCLQIFYSN